MEGNGIQWGAPLPEYRGPWLPIIRAVPDVPVSLLIVSDRVLTTLEHYHAKRSYPHIEPKEACEGCLRNQLPRGYGYLGCWHPRKGRHVLAQLTHQALWDSKGEILEAKHSLRGYWLRLRRIGVGACGRVEASLAPPSPMDCPLPPAFDVQAALLRLWGGEPIE